MPDRFCGGCGAALDEVAARREVKPIEAQPDGAVAELLEAAREGAVASADDSEIRVAQEDIDSLFGD
jgi:hypothetical protein